MLLGFIEKQFYSCGKNLCVVTLIATTLIFIVVKGSGVVAVPFVWLTT